MIGEKDFSSDDMLYRFRSDSEYNFEALLRNEMFAATPNVLNDPLDCPITYDLDVLYRKLLKRTVFAQTYANMIFPSPQEERINSIESYEAYISINTDQLHKEACDKLFDDKNGSIVKDFINALAKEVIFDVRECFGIVSFSLTLENSVMWSHYASNYRGFVLANKLLSFNKAINEFVNSSYYLNKFKDICGLYKVKYVSTEEMNDGTDLMYELLCKKMSQKYRNREMLDLILRLKHKDLLVNLLTTKEKSWEYEQEIRLVFPRAGSEHSFLKIIEEPVTQYFKVFNRYIPNEIIIGSNMSDVKLASIGYYCIKNKKLQLQKINTERLMTDRSLSKTSIEPEELV